MCDDRKDRHKIITSTMVAWFGVVWCFVAIPAGELADSAVVPVILLFIISDVVLLAVLACWLYVDYRRSKKLSTIVKTGVPCLIMLFLVYGISGGCYRTWQGQKMCRERFRELMDAKTQQQTGHTPSTSSPHEQ